MAPKIFITGTTGYIGGDAFYALSKAHPEYEYTALVRNSSRGATVAASYPKVRLVYGSLDDAALLEAESSAADIVLHTADSSDHSGAAKAIAKGIAAGHTKEHPGFWIHVSGTGILTWHDMEAKVFGDAPTQPPYDDLEGVAALTSLPDSAWHRDVDKIVLGASSDATKTAIVCPPTIYGPGRGPGNTRSIQVYGLAKAELEMGQPLRAGKGLTQWDHVHVSDLSELFVLLVEAAVGFKEKGDDVNAEIWGEKGYFLAENGYHVWGEVAQQVGEIALKKGYIKEKEVKVIELEEATKIPGAATFGLNSRGHANRARKILGWKPKGRSLKDELADIVDGEAKSLGLKIGHAEKVAGEQ